MELLLLGSTRWVATIAFFKSENVESRLLEHFLIDAVSRSLSSWSFAPVINLQVP